MLKLLYIADVGSLSQAKRDSCFYKNNRDLRSRYRENYPKTS
jgi:hypothetical protein